MVTSAGNADRANEELAEGIEDMQITYGVDTNNDKAVDQYVTANAVADWATVLSVRISLLLASVGLVGEQQQSREALINAQMRMALAKVAFLPFGLMIDRWRWGVFDGSIKPDRYNKAWWELKAKYQGVAPVSARGEDFFDPGAKYHVPGNTPYTRYFLSHVLQFQFYKALCDASGFKGPL